MTTPLDDPLGKAQRRGDFWKRMAERLEADRDRADKALAQALQRATALDAVVARVRQMTDCWEQQLPEVIRTPAVVSALRAALEHADANAHTEAPIFRHCLYPACLREYDVAAWMNGKEPARPSWSGKGWRQVRPTIATGNVCPDHAQAVEQHAPRWAERTGDTCTLLCACGWTSPAARWPRYAVAAWQNHLLETSEADSGTKEL